VQEESDVSAVVGCGHVFGLLLQPILAAGHDVIRGPGPNQCVALMNRVSLYGFSRSNGSTVSHHVVFTPAIRERYAFMVYAYFFIASPSYLFNLPQVSR